MIASLSIDTITFKNGVKLQLEKDSIVLFVGANNSGKSMILQEIYNGLAANLGQLSLINNLTVRKEGDFQSFLEKMKPWKRQDNYLIPGGSYTDQVMKQMWEEVLQSHDRRIKELFVKYMNTRNRTDLVNSIGSIDFLDQIPVQPLHILHQDTDKEKMLSRAFFEAFGQELVINHGAGQNIHLHVGVRPEATLEHDRVSKEFQLKLRKLPQLAYQGDGMKSFAGILMTLFLTDNSVNLIDEPEAFLHPPQATLLGRMMAKKFGDNNQLLIATHSEHILKGLLESAANRLIVVRLDRQISGTNFHILENKKLREIWSDPILKHSNILNGLFHKKTILCESDSDSQFYNAIMSAIVQKENLVNPDLLFVNSNGKHRFPVVARALNSLKVPLTIIGDFDFYHDENPIRKLFEEMEGNWEQVKDDFRKVKTSIDNKRPQLQKDELKSQIDEIFIGVSEEVFPEEKIKRIKDLLKKSSPWTEAKSSGKAYLNAGEATLAFNRLQIKFKEKNIFILELGEIESFDKTIGGHGPSWVNSVLEKDILENHDLEDARRFVSETIIA